jgi:hypothetical protein
MLTGELVPIDEGAGTDTFAGALVRRGEATAIAAAPWTRTKFGRTAEVVRSAHAVSTQQKARLKIIRNRRAKTLFVGNDFFLCGCEKQTASAFNVIGRLADAFGFTVPGPEAFEACAKYLLSRGYS